MIYYLIPITILVRDIFVQNNQLVTILIKLRVILLRQEKPSKIQLCRENFTYKLSNHMHMHV